MASLVRVDSPSVWTPRDFPDESAWSFELTGEHQLALIDFGRGGPSTNLTRQIGSIAVDFAQLLNDGPGFVRLRNFPVDALTEPEIERAYIGLGTLLGRPVAQDRHANLITHIRDERKEAQPGRKYQTNLSQDFHSDASDLVGLLCLKPAKTGGMSKIVSSHAVYNEMLRRDPRLVEVMSAPMPWSRHVQTHQGTAPYFLLAPITTVDGMPRIFFIPWYIRHSQLHPTAPRLTDDQLAALALMEEVANDQALRIEMVFRPGDVQLLNNTTVLHSRDAYEDEKDPTLRRHLLRLWLATATSSANDLLPAASYATPTTTKTEGG